MYGFKRPVQGWVKLLARRCLGRSHADQGRYRKRKARNLGGEWADPKGCGRQDCFPFSLQHPFAKNQEPWAKLRQVAKGVPISEAISSICAVRLRPDTRKLHYPGDGTFEIREVPSPASSRKRSRIIPSVERQTFQR
jgi:hypothetical protein